VSSSGGRTGFVVAEHPQLGALRRQPPGIPLSSPSAAATSSSNPRGSRHDSPWTRTDALYALQYDAQWG
jgi:hypothetical protein